jgi:hypothetical protein
MYCVVTTNWTWICVWHNYKTLCKEPYDHCPMAIPDSEYEINLKYEYGNRWTCFHFYLTRATGSSELLPSLFIQHPLTVHILIFSSRTTGPNWTELGCGTPWMVLLALQRFQVFQPIRSHGSHLGCRARSVNTLLEEDHPRSATSKFGSIWASINCSHFDLLLKNHWTKLNRTWMWHSLDGPLPKVCSLILPYIQDGCHGFWLVMS